MDREKVIAGLTMLTDRTNDDTCEGLKCCKIAEDALALLKEQEAVVRCKDCAFRNEINCPQYYRRTELTDDYFCADGKHKEGW